MTNINIEQVNIYHHTDEEKNLNWPIPKTDSVNVVATPQFIPKVGELWPEQGGILAGIMPSEDDRPGWYLIIPTDDRAYTEELRWGNSGHEYTALTNNDGARNTQHLIEHGDHSASGFCSKLELNGFSDYYLPSRREASLMAATVPHLFKAGYHWTSSQYSASYAYIQYFSDGGQDYYLKSNPSRVRAVRRFIINHSSI